jgi:transposase
MDNDKYVGMDVDKAITVVAVLDGTGKLVAEAKIETNGRTIKDFVKGLSGKVHLTFEEGTQAAWLHGLMKPLVAELIVCDPRRNKLMAVGNKADAVDARKLAELLRVGSLKAVYHGDDGTKKLKEVVRLYLTLMSDTIRVMNRIKAIYRSRGIDTTGTAVYRADGRLSWTTQILDEGSRIRLESCTDNWISSASSESRLAGSL